MIAKAEDTIKGIDEALVKSRTVSEEIVECLKTTEETKNSVQQHLMRLNTLQSIHQYLRVLQFVENLRLLFTKNLKFV